MNSLSHMYAPLASWVPQSIYTAIATILASVGMYGIYRDHLKAMRVFYLFYCFTDLAIWIISMFFVPVLMFNVILPAETQKCEDAHMEPCSNHTAPMVMQCLMIVGVLLVGTVFHVYTSRIIYQHYQDSVNAAAGKARKTIIDDKSSVDSIPKQPRRPSLLKTSGTQISAPLPTASSI